MSLTSPTIASSSAWVSRSKLVFLGRYRRILPFLFSLCLLTECTIFRHRRTSGSSPITNRRQAAHIP